jgi:hypothetical protein
VGVALAVVMEHVASVRRGGRAGWQGSPAVAYQLRKGSPLRAFPGAPLRISPVAGV